jgi:hypothetical protein
LLLLRIETEFGDCHSTMIDEDGNSTASAGPVRHYPRAKLLKPTVGLELGVSFESVYRDTLSAIVNCVRMGGKKWSLK